MARADVAKFGLSQLGLLVQDAVDFFVPPRCVQCKKTGSAYCERCREAVQWVREPICQKCGGRMGRRNGRICRRCQQNMFPHIEKIRTAVHYGSPLSEVIHKFKYEKLFGLAKPLAQLMVQAWPRWQMEVDVVVPITLYKTRLKERGYNQSALLVRQFCRLVPLPADEKALARVRETERQATLSATARAQNVQDAFVARQERVAGKRVLLVDDVCTTGATLDSAAKALMAAGATTAVAYCLARA